MRLFLLSLLLLISSAVSAAIPRDSVEYFYKEAEKMFMQGDHRQALRLFELSRSYVTPRSDYENKYLYSDLLDYIATLKCEFGEVDAAIALEDEVILWRQDHKSDYGVLGAAFSKKAIFYSYKKDYDAAIQCAEVAEGYLRRRFGVKNHIYCVNLQNLASYHSMRGASPQDYQKAVAYCERAIKHIDSGTPEYAYALNNLVVYYSQAEMREKAMGLTQKALQKGRSIFGKRSRGYADILANQAITLAAMRNYSLAIDYSLEARGIYEADSAVHELPYARVLNGLGSFCKQAERFDLGIEALTRAQAVYQENHSEGTQEYISCVSNLAALYRLKGDLEKADEIALQTEQLIDASQDEGNYLTFGKSLSEQAWMYAANGDFKRAIATEQRAYQVFAENGDTLNMAVSMNDLSSHYFKSGQQEQAVQLCQQSIDLLLQHRIASTALGRAYNNLSIYNYRMGDNQRALQLSRQAVRNYEEMEDTQSSMYAKILGSLAVFYYLNDSLDMAVRISQRSLDIQRATLGPEHPDLVVTYHNLANYFLALNDKKQMRDYFEHAMEMQARLVRNNFSHLTTSGRELYWATKSYIFKIAPILASRSGGEDALVADAYNSLLFTKGILLNSEIDFKNFLMQTGKTELLTRFEELESLHKRIDDYRHSASATHGEMVRLEQQASRLERDLMRDCKEFGDFTSNLSITYQQVADSLADDAVAIEFVDMPMENGDRHYAALYIRHGWKYPKFLSLFPLSKLVNQDYVGGNLYQALNTTKTTAGINSIYNHPQVGHLVWFKLMEAIGDDVRTIYFSPTGIFYQLGIEYMKYNLEQRINERYDIHRLSSTKSIAQSKSHTPLQNAVVYGGLRYDMDAEEMLTRHQAYSAQTINLLAMSDGDNTRALFDANAMAVDSLSRAGLNVEYLPGTLTEAEAVNAALQSYGIRTQLFTENEGTEESFKSLSGKGISLLHIATHGFYFSDADQRNNKLVLKITGEASELSEQDRSMNCSGLLLSGANTILRNRRVPKGVENGVLTAKEISQLDFRGLDLVVLSACQTGKGELKEDGVYGLQRAFKKAGAKTLLMSLWNVSDAATQRMMSSFYSSLAAGASRHEAFAAAQQAVRSAGFTDPYYWASFIMLDDNE